MKAGCTIVLEPVRCAAPFEAFHVDGLRFPLDGAEAFAVKGFVTRVMQACGMVSLGQPTVWLDSRPLHLNGGSKLYAERGAEWGSRWGFGFDPSARPPRKVQFQDFLDLKFGDELRIDQRSNFFVRYTEHSMDAYQTMAGRGLCTVLGFAEKDVKTAGERYMKHTRDVLYPRFPPGEFGSYRYYLPLLSSASVAGASAQSLSGWMGEASVYLREAYDTGELLLVTAQPARPLLQAAGLRALSSAAETPWEFIPEQERADAQ